VLSNSYLLMGDRGATPTPKPLVSLAGNTVYVPARVRAKLLQIQ